MAIRYAVATGNWSSTATWDGGTLPTSADDVYANNRTVTIDQNVTVLTLRTTSGTGITAGGKFTMPSGNAFNVTATNGFIAGSGSALEILGAGTRTISGSATGSSTTTSVNTIYVQHISGNIPVVTINGNLTGGAQTNAMALYIWGGYVTVNGSVTGGTASTSAAGINIFNSDNQPTQLTVNTGPVTGGSSSSGSTAGISVGYNPTGSALTNSFVNINCAIVGGSLQASNIGYSHTSNINSTVVGNITPAVGTGMNWSSNGTCSITGNVNCTGVAGVGVNLSGGTGTMTITGTITAGTGAIAVGKSNNGANNLIVNGNVFGGSGSQAAAVRVDGTGTTGSIVINGDAYGAPSSGYGVRLFQSGGCTVTINGNVYGASGGSSAYGAVNETIYALTINGNAYGGAGSSAVGAFNSSTGTLTINGSAIAGTGSNSHGAQNNSTGLMVVTKAVGNGYGPGSVGISQTFGVASNNIGAVTRVRQIELGPLGAFPLFGAVSFIDDTINQAAFPTTTGGTKTLVDPNSTGLMPAVSNVRLGTTYSSGNLTGTMAVPAASSVAAGVAVDNTTGTAVLTQANVWNYALSSASSVAGSVGEKLKKTAIPADIIALG